MAIGKCRVILLISVAVVCVIVGGVLFWVYGHKVIPCGNNMEREGRIITGTCVCSRSTLNPRPLLPDRKRSECFFLHTQGPCNNWEWLTLVEESSTNDTVKAVCTTNPCRKNQDHVLYKGECLEIGAKCGDGNQILYDKYSGELNCTSENSASHALGTGGSIISCESGVLLNGKCFPNVEVDFD